MLALQEAESTEIHSSGLQEASRGTSCVLRFGMRASGVTGSTAPAALGDSPFVPAQAYESFQSSCACRRLFPEGVFIHRPTSWAECLSGSLQPKADSTWDTSKVHSEWIEKTRKTQKKGNDRILQPHL